MMVDAFGFGLTQLERDLMGGTPRPGEQEQHGQSSQQPIHFPRRPLPFRHGG